MIVVGAGCAGLACARALADAGHHPVVLDKARGVGGRAATRRIDGQPVDLGAAFYHGSDEAFLEALDGVGDASRLDGWPLDVVGEGPACLPRAFGVGERRLAFAEGMTVFPKTLARQLDVRLQARVQSIALLDETFELVLEGGDRSSHPVVVLALPIEQMRELIAALPSSRQLAGVQALLAPMATSPCITLIATYPLDRPVASWDMCYPDDSDLLLLASHDSQKRPDRSFHAFVFQCSARYSQQALDDDPSTWTASILDEASQRFGSWAASPARTETHVWRFSRAVSAPLSQPIWIRLPGGQKLGLTGEAFHPSLGIEGAYLAGRALAAMV